MLLFKSLSNCAAKETTVAGNSNGYGQQDGAAGMLYLESERLPYTCSRRMKASCVVFWYCQKEAINSGCIDEVLPLNDIAGCAVVSAYKN